LGKITTTPTDRAGFAWSCTFQPSARQSWFVWN